MMKRSQLCLAMTFVSLLFSQVIKADMEMKFQFVHNGTPLKDLNATVTVYSKAVAVGRVEEWHLYDQDPFVKVILPDELAGVTLAYRSSLGHEGHLTATADSTVNLDCKQLTVKFLNANGNPMEGAWININKTNVTVSAYSNRAGLAYLYAAASNGYRYSSSYGNGYLDLMDDAELTIQEPKQTPDPIQPQTHRVTLVPYYDDLPVIFDDTFYIYGKDWSMNIWPTQGIMKWDLAAGEYELCDPNEGRQKFTVGDRDTTIYFAYHKVEVFSRGSEPNANVGIGLGKEYWRRTSNTDAEGRTVFYLLPGTYKYYHANGSGNFTVGDEDMQLNLEAYRVRIQLDGDQQAFQGLANFFYVMPMANGKEVGSSMHLDTQDGQLSLLLAPGDYMLRNSQLTVSNMQFHVGGDNSDLNILVHALRFLTSDGSQQSLMLRRDGFRDNLGSGTAYYLLEGDYEYSFDGIDWKALKLNKDIDLTCEYFTYKVTVNDTNGEPVTNGRVTLTGGEGMSYTAYLSGSNVAEFHCLPGTYTLMCDAFNSSAKQVTVEANGSEQLTIPGIVTFFVTLNGEPFYGSIRFMKEGTQESYGVYGSVEGGFTARLDTDALYSLLDCRGTTRITDGCTIEIGTLSISSEGLGLAFPMDNWNAVSTYRVLKGSSVRLTAIPVRDDRFQKWVINGKEYEEPVVEYTMTELNTEAKAVFSGEAASAVRGPKASATEWTVESDGQLLRLPRDVEGRAAIYSTDGRLVKSFYVVGSTIGIYDLPQGTYILTLAVGSDNFTAKFLR